MNKKVFFLLTASWFWVTLALRAQNHTSIFDRYMQAQTDLYGFNGNVLVAQNGKVVYKKSSKF